MGGKGRWMLLLMSIIEDCSRRINGRCRHDDCSVDDCCVGGGGESQSTSVINGTSCSLLVGVRKGWIPLRLVCVLKPCDERRRVFIS